MQLSPDTKINKFISHTKNAVPKELCKKILDEYVDTDLWEAGYVRSDYESKFTAERTRTCDEIRISDPQVIGDSESRKFIDDALYQHITKAVNRYVNKNSWVSIDGDIGYTLLRYKTGQYIKQHCDVSSWNHKTISVSVGLNHDFEGGEFCFWDGQVKYAHREGDILIFPSHFMFPHEVSEVTSGTRYSIITWLR